MDDIASGILLRSTRTSITKEIVKDGVMLLRRGKGKDTRDYGHQIKGYVSENRFASMRGGLILTSRHCLWQEVMLRTSLAVMWEVQRARYRGVVRVWRGVIKLQVFVSHHIRTQHSLIPRTNRLGWVSPTQTRCRISRPRVWLPRAEAIAVTVHHLNALPAI